jgi:hypothetical protein
LKTEYLRFIPGLRSNFRQIQRLNQRVNDLKEQRTRLQQERQSHVTGSGVSEQRSERIEWISSQVPFNIVDRSIHISLKHRYLFVETPKVACSSVKKTLIRLELDAPKLALDSDTIHLRKLSPLLQPSQLSNIADILDSEALHRFVFVRNPYSRTLSAYLQIVRNPYPGRRLLLARSGSEALENDGVIEFPDFLRAVAEQSIDAMDPHWRPQFYQCFFETIDFDFVGRFENFDSDLARCAERFGGEQHIGTYASHSTSASHKLAEYYSPETLELVNKIFAVDFENLQYDLIAELPDDPDRIPELLITTQR